MEPQSQEKVISYTGLNRAIPQSDSPAGSCQEMINVRHRKGCFRPIGQKKTYTIADIPVAINDQFDNIYLHDIEGGLIDGEPNWIGLDSITHHLSIIDPTTGISTVIGLYGGDLFMGNVKVVFLKRTMIVTSDSGVKVYLWTIDKKYQVTASLTNPEITMLTTNPITVNIVPTVESHDAAAVLGDYFTLLNDQSRTEGRLFGSIMYITAYKLFDGSYILPSIPKYFQISNGGQMFQNNVGGHSSQSGALWYSKFTLAQLQVTLSGYFYTDELIGGTKDLIDSICVFATRATTIHQIDESTLTNANLLKWFGPSTNDRYFKDIYPVSEDFKKLAKSTGWYKIHEFPFEEVIGAGLITKTVDTKGYYQDYANRDTLTTDQFSHHKLTAKAAYVYNDRLHLANIKTSLGLPYIIWPLVISGYIYGTPIAAIPTSWVLGKLSVWVKTSLGQAVVTSDISIPIYTINSVDNFVLPELLGYNDARAYKMQISVTLSGVDYVLFSEALTRHDTMNLAYWHNSLFSPDESNVAANFNQTYKQVSSITYPATVPVDIALPFDPNRVQVSEIQNPLFFPTKNSYQIGTGSILGIMAGSEPLSTGQFGQFPLHVFTTKGIWAMEIGTGEVLYTNVLPVNGEVINNPANLVPVGSGVVYTTDMGIFVVNGRQVTEIGEIVEGVPATDLTGIPEIQFLLDNIVTNTHFTPGLDGTLSSTNFLNYLLTSSVGYDQLNKELVITNPSYSYSYIFSFETKIWFKISQSFELLINDYPRLLGRNSSSIVSLSEETTDQNIECLIISNAQNFDQGNTYKKIISATQRTVYSSDSGKMTGFYIFASNDLVTWQLITGKQKDGTKIKDLPCLRSHCSAKYYVFVFCGTLAVTSEIKQVEVVFKNKWDNRLR